MFWTQFKRYLSRVRWPFWYTSYNTPTLWGYCPKCRSTQCLYVCEVNQVAVETEIWQSGWPLGKSDCGVYKSWLFYSMYVYLYTTHSVTMVVDHKLQSHNIVKTTQDYSQQHKSTDCYWRRNLPTTMLKIFLPTRQVVRSIYYYS